MKARYFVIAAVLLFLFGLNQLSVNRSKSAALAAKVASDDSSGIDAQVSLVALQQFASRHMAASQDVFLQGSFDRATAQATAASATQGNGKVYADAQAACNSKADSIVQARCVQTYVATHSQPADNPQPVVMPDHLAYEKSFQSPGWTADAAGLSLTASLVLGTLGIAYAVIRRL